jgi:hypothetical protein
VAETVPVDRRRSGRQLDATKTHQRRENVLHAVPAATVRPVNLAVTPPARRQVSAPLAHRVPAQTEGPVPTRTVGLAPDQVLTAAVARPVLSVRTVLNSRR